MIIRTYNDADEQGWLFCRVLSFLDCSYYNDVKTAKEKYDHPSICLVAEDNGSIVGLIDIELDSDDLACNGDERGAIIWHMAVMPQYRRQGVAGKLWKQAKAQLLSLGIHYCELWTQEDVPANQFYQSIGFALENSQTWIRCYAQGKSCLELLNSAEIGKIYGPEELVFD
ncbi:GNAT family N-acetyltransferase, partial [Caproicibacter sp.]|uniref:GNAT family N-acetyltransferase n=1 Tax=Caproicibacter sp. TaxID=2814884 RepID=UPI00398A049C